LQRKRLQFHWPARDDEDVRAIVEEAFLAASVDVLVALTDTSAPSDAGAFKIAVRIVEGWRAAQWTHELNLRGDAPSTRLILGLFAMRRLTFSPAVRPDPLGHAGESAARLRVARWRRLWGGRIAAVPVREEVPAAELRSKALARDAAQGGLAVPCASSVGLGLREIRFRKTDAFLKSKNGYHFLVGKWVSS